VASVVRAGSGIEYEVTGEGPPLVLLHGIFGDPSTWHAAGHVGALADQFRLVLIDLVGHGGSDAPPDPARYRMDEHARDVVAVLDSLAGDRDPRLDLIRATGDRLSRAEVVVLPGCGHFDTFTRTDLTVPLAREFLGRPRP
jgi:pimeloyl-ACP methyl ester carboxylesterase